MEKILEKKFIEFITRNNLINKGDKILAGVSGGVDSMTLLYLLNKIKNRFSIDIAVAHVNYCLRGEDSDKDQKVVENYCKTLNIPFHLLNIKLKSELKHDSLQVKAREVRYKFYDKICNEFGYNKIAIAHNANDNAETVLLNMFRGAGIEGLRGIPITRENIIRPISYLKRKEILSFAKQEKIKFRHDKSNFKDVYKRNFVRLKLLPVIEERINPSAVDIINQFSHIFTEFSEFAEEYVKNAVRSVRTTNNTSEFSLDIKKLNNYINFIRKKVIISCYYDFTNETLSYDKVLKILELVDSQAGKKLFLKKNIALWKERDHIVFRKNSLRTKADAIANLSIGEKIEVENGIIQISKTDYFERSNNGDQEYIDKDLVKGDFLIRIWKAGDFFYPIGMKKKKKVSDFLTDIKVASSGRKSVVVLENSGKIVWVIGYRLDDRFKCTDKTKNILKIELKRN